MTQTTSPTTTSPDDPTAPGRRRALRLFGAGGLAVAATACGGSGSDGASGTTAANPTTTAGSAGDAVTTTTAATGGSTSCEVIPEETGGPYPADGSNGPNVLDQDGVVRSDITSSFGDYSGTADGVPLTITLRVVDVAAGCTPYAGAAVYLWHCDREGRYSLYSQGATDQNYLRGVQAADAVGALTFESIFPACYDGRWPHIHFEVYPTLDDAAAGAGKLRTSQLAFPSDVCDAVYATEGYESSIRTLSRVSLDRDMVFRDGASLQTPQMSGDAATGYTATLTVPV